RAEAPGSRRRARGGAGGRAERVVRARSRTLELHRACPSARRSERERETRGCVSTFRALALQRTRARTRANPECRLHSRGKPHHTEGVPRCPPQNREEAARRSEAGRAATLEATARPENDAPRRAMARAAPSSRTRCAC